MEATNQRLIQSPLGEIIRTRIDGKIGKNSNFEPSFPSYVIYSLMAMQLRRSWKIHANFNLDNSPRHSEEAFSGNLPCLPIHVIYSFIPYFRTEIGKNRQVRAARIEK